MNWLGILLQHLVISTLLTYSSVLHPSINLGNFLAPYSHLSPGHPAFLLPSNLHSTLLLAFYFNSIKLWTNNPYKLKIKSRNSSKCFMTALPSLLTKGKVTLINYENHFYLFLKDLWAMTSTVLFLKVTYTCSGMEG